MAYLSVSAKRQIICIFILLNPLIEVLYSLSLNSSVVASLNTVYRAAMMVAFYLIMKNRKFKEVIVVFFCLCMVTFSLRQFFIPSTSFGNDVGFEVKATFALVCMVAFIDFFDQGILSIQQLLKVLTVAAVFIAFNVLLSSDDIVTNARVRRTGLFTFGNYLVVPIVVALYSLLLCRVRGRVALGMLFLAALFLMGNRFAQIAAVIFLCGIIAFVCAKKNSVGFALPLTLVLVILFLLLLPFFGEKIADYIEGQIELYQRYRYTSFFSYLLSNRDLQVQYVWDYIDGIALNKGLALVLGIGSSASSYAVNMGKSSFQSLEMDAWNLLFGIGIVSTIFLVIGIVLVGKKVSDAFRGNRLRGLLLLLLFSTIGIQSIFGGHVLTESLVLPYVGFAALLLYRGSVPFGANPDFSILQDTTKEEQLPWKNMQ